MSARLGATDLPEEQEKALHKAKRLEWISIGVLVITVTLVGLTAGQSQAMKTAFLEDMLSFIPPIAFLIAVHRARKAPSPDHPYAHHRALGAAYLVASIALLAMGLWLILDAGSGLLKGERPPIGTTTLFGHTIWSGWLMMLVMFVTSIPAVILGRMKEKVAKPLHDKVLYADADMQKADWTSAAATIASVAGIGFGLWWADAAAALLVSISIVHDGLTNLKRAVFDLVDRTASPIDKDDPHPLLHDAQQVVRTTNWVGAAAVRMRDMGHLFHTEVFVVPVAGIHPTVDDIDGLRSRVADLDWKTADTVVAVVKDLPEGLEQVGPQAEGATQRG